MFVQFKKLSASFVALLSVSSLLLAKPEVTQELSGLMKPTVAVFSPDYESLLVANFARSEIGAKKGKSYVSKFRVDSEGKLTLSSKRFLEGLTAPQDIAFSSVSYGAVPKGSIFVAVGTPLVEDDEGRLVKDPARELIGLSIFDANNGRMLKAIDLGPTSNNPLRKEMPLVSPASIVFDKAGNLYISDSGIGGNLFQSKVRGRPGIWRISREGVRGLIRGKSPEAARFVPISSMPGPMRYVEKEDSIYIIANHNVGIPQGAVFKVACKDFNSKGMTSMQTIVRDLSPLSGIQISPRGRILLTTSSGELVFPKGRKNYGTIRIYPRVRFSSPGNFSMMEREDGYLLLPIPELTGDDGANDTQTMKIVTLDERY